MPSERSELAYEAGMQWLGRHFELEVAATSPGLCEMADWRQFGSAGASFRRISIRALPLGLRYVVCV